MPKLYTITGADLIVKKFTQEIQRSKNSDDVSVVVGYTAEYAIYVHEDLEALHGAAYNAAYIVQEQKMIKRGKKKGQFKTVLRWSDRAIRMGYHKHEGTGKDKKPKLRGANQKAQFLIDPFVTNKKKYVHIVQSACKKGATLGQGLKLAGLSLQRDSQEIVPVEYGFLKASAFTKAE